MTFFGTHHNTFQISARPTKIISKDCTPHPFASKLCTLCLLTVNFKTLHTLLLPLYVLQLWLAMQHRKRIWLTMLLWLAMQHSKRIRRSETWGKTNPERMERNSQKIGARSGSRWRIVCNLLGSQFDHLQFRKGICRSYHRRRDLITSPWQ